MTTTTTDSVRVLPLDHDATVEVFLTSSSIRVLGTDAAQLVIRTRGGEALDDEVAIDAAPGRVRVNDAEGGLRLGPIRLRSRRTADIDIEVPRGASLAIRSVSGDLDATGIRGASRWTTASGDIRLALETGPVAIETMSGDALVTGEGSLAVTARTVSGGLRLAAPLLDGLDLATTSGDVRVEGELRPDRKHVIASVSGDVDLATASPVRVETRTIAGDVHVKGPHRTEGGRGRRVVVIGSGSIPVEIRTTSGDISLRALPGETIPMPPSAPATLVAPAPPAPLLAPAPLTAPAPLAAPEPRVAPVPPAPAVSAAALGAEPAVDRREAARLEILRALERGEVDVDTASHRLEILEDAGPRSFRGWL